MTSKIGIGKFGILLIIIIVAVYTIWFVFCQDIIQFILENAISTVTGEPAITQNLLFASDSVGCHFFALDRECGKIVWAYKCDDAIATGQAAVVSSMGIFIADIGGNIYLFRSAI